MKHTSGRILSLLLSALMILSSLALTLTMLPALTVGAADVSIQNGTGNREAIETSQTLGYRAIINAPFTGFGFNMPTWNTTDSECTLSVYKWAGKFDATLKTEPIASKRFAPMTDNAANWVEFDEQPAGEYLFLVSEPKGKAGVWANTSVKDPKGFLYDNGDEGRGEPELKIRFVDTPAEPFGTCEASVTGDKPTTVDLFAPPLDTSVENVVDSLAVRVNTTCDFIGVNFKLATYYATDMEIDYAVYKWKDAYEASVAEEPLRVKRITLRDNQMQGVRFDVLPAGEYVLVLSNSNGDPAVYVMNGQTGFPGVVYRHGVEQESRTNSVPVMQIVFAREQGEYFAEPSKGSDGVDGKHTAPEPYVIPADSLIYTHEVMPDTWVFTDALGRTSLTNADVGDLRPDKTIAIFYWTWHIGGSTAAEPFNNEEFMREHTEVMHDYKSPLWPTNANFFWNKPIYGYYKTNDDWVLRRQAELLADAGVDVIFTDNTNGTSTWRESYMEVYKTWYKAMQDGVKTPKVSFMLPFWDANYTSIQMQDMYLDIFRPGKYQNLWYYLDGKPMVMAHGDFINPSASLTYKEVFNFFTWRANDPDYMTTNPQYGHWGWLSMYPQTVYYATSRDKKENKPEQITVGVAMNHNYVLHQLAAMNGENIAGRSYTSDLSHIGEENASLWGYNLAEQFENALKVDPSVIFVTGWNEWKAGRYESWPEGAASAVENAFPDQCRDEYSRDIEPTWGDLKDNYLYELVNYVRRFKGARPIPAPTAAATIDPAAGASAWEDVGPYYAAYIGNTGDRDAKGYGSNYYTEYSGRNDIIGAKVARDADNVYFWVECQDDITPYTDKLWMNLYIDCDQSNQGWETFDFVLNKSAASAETAVLEKFTGKGYASEKVADVAYKVDGKTMTVVIPKSALGLTGYDFTINFAWTDNVHDNSEAAPAGQTDFEYKTFSGDILNFYVSGDVAPGGRFKYSYISTAENAAGIVETAPETENTTTPETAAGTTAATDAETGKSSKGCKSALPLAAAVTAAGAALLMKRRKQEND